MDSGADGTATVRRASYALVWVILGVTLIGWAVETIKPVTLAVNPAIGMTGKSLCISVTVPRHTDNRILATAIDCERFYRSWQEQLNGEDAAYARRHCVDSMPAGACAIGVALFRLDGSKADGIAVYRDRQTACFAGGEAQC